MATFLAGPTARQLQGATEQDRFQIWLQGLGDLARSRYDIIALVDGERRITAINEMALSVPLARPLGAESFVGRDVAALLGEADDQWIRRTLKNRLPSTLSWRAIATVNELYTRKEITRPDDVVRSHQLVFAVPVRQPDGGSTRALIAVVSWAPFQRILDQAEAFYSPASGCGAAMDSCSTAAAIASSVTSSGIRKPGTLIRVCRKGASST